MVLFIYTYKPRCGASAVCSLSAGKLSSCTKLKLTAAVRKVTTAVILFVYNNEV